ncbi:TPA: DUF1120 domain-containing protein [Enterobacter chengduensis]|nr:DUF1120 domain-containing protein [Enterobacter chengduensis]
MRKILLSSTIAMVLSSASYIAHAAESASLAVTGTITPSTCNVNMTSASLDFSTISASTLTKDFNLFQASPLKVTVVCDAATAVALQTTDNRASSAMTIAEVNSEMKAPMNTSDDHTIFGLGSDSANNKVGALILGIESATLNGNENSNLLTSTDKSTWSTQAISANSGYVLAKGGYFALAENAASTTPAPVSEASYSLQGGIVLKKADKYPSGENVNIDGNVTFSVVYL